MSKILLWGLWYQRVTNCGGKDANIGILDMKNFEIYIEYFWQIPLKMGQITLRRTPDAKIWNTDDRLKAMIQEYGKTLFHPFNQDGLRFKCL